jgi:hypothetical protein
MVICRYSSSSAQTLSGMSSSQNVSSTPNTLSSYLPPDMHSRYMTPQSYTSATLPRRLPSQVNSSKNIYSPTTKYPAISSATPRKELLGSVDLKVKKDLICPPSTDRTQPSSNLKSYSTTGEHSSKSSFYPSALSTSYLKDISNDIKYQTNPTIRVSSTSSYSNKPISSSRLSSEDLRYSSLPRSSTYRSSSGYSTPSSSYSSSYQTRATSIQPSYKRISPHSFSSYYSPSANTGMSILEEHKNRRKYITKSEAALSRPSERPW